MFATMRRKRRSTKMKSELGQSVDHFKRAATIAAQETSATVAPRIDAARGRVQPAVSQARDVASSGWESAVATITPLVTAVADNVRHASQESAKAGRKSAKVSKKKARKLEKRASKVLGRQQSSGRAGRLVGLALIGAAVGAGAAWYMRRKQAAQWDEYDPAPATEPVGADDAAFEPGPPSTLTFVEDPSIAESSSGRRAES